MAELVTATGDVDNSALGNVNLLDSADVLAIGNNSASGTAVFDTLDSLPTSNLSEGQQAFVNANQRFYISNGAGWYNLTLVNRTPRWLTEPSATYDIVDSATPLIVTAKATDSDNSDVNLVNQSIVSDSAQYMVNISNDSSVWTFTPKSADSIGIEVAAGNLTDSNGDFVYTFKWSDGINFVSKASTITYSPSASAAAEYIGQNIGEHSGTTGGQTTTLALPAGTQAGDYVVAFITNHDWGSGGAGFSGNTISNGNFGSPDLFNFGSQAGSDTYATGWFVDPSISQSAINTGLQFTANSGTSYDVFGMMVFRNVTEVLKNMQRFDYNGETTNTDYERQGAARPTGYATKTGMGELIVSRSAGRVYVNGDPGGSPNSCLIQQQGASYAGTSPIFGAAIYHNAESYGLGQPYSKYSNAIDPGYSHQSIVFAY